jgi:hypothetical protein
VFTSSALRLAQLATEMSEPVPLTLLLHEELDRHDTLRMRCDLQCCTAAGAAQTQQQRQQASMHVSRCDGYITTTK